MHARGVLLLVAFALLHPASARCAPGYDLRTGIRRDGRFACWPHPIAPRSWRRSDGPIEDWDGTYGRPDRSVQPAGVIGGRIWCGTGAVPLVMDERSAARRGVPPPLKSTRLPR